ncbi:GerAB/ArcD/ProY family transporter [Faecalispora anaeroviscerum]|uniref:GerAB/ArcD/ProY family transporter n=1 Tax=Faecalispora anaeroviscerum TaxID=2991836 RepID=UPI0024BBA646|nr:endospore germination permease [Faecalispora anaeroviscerum]
MNKEIITNHQLFSLTACATCGSSIIVVASPVTELCQRDGWIASLLSSVFGVVFLLLYYYLGKLFPNKNLIQIINTVFGKWLGGIISIYFIIFCIHSGIQITDYIGQFITTEYLILSPVYAVNLLIIVILAIGLLYGLETTARSSEMLLRLAIIILSFLIITNITNIQINYVLPVLENGFYPILKGSLFITSYRIWPLIFLNMIYPIHTDHSSSALKSMLKGYFLGSLIMFLIMLMSILVLGTHVTSISTYSTYFLAKQISFGFLSRVEGLIVCAWLVTLFFKGFCYFYAGIQGISSLLHLRDYRKIVLPILFLVLIYSNIVYPSSAYLAYWDKYVWISYSFTAGVILPVAIVLVHFIKKAFLKTGRPELAQNSA